MSRCRAAERVTLRLVPSHTTTDPTRADTATDTANAAFVFDMDGVLVDSERPFLRTLHALLTEAGVAHDRDGLRHLCGQPAPALRAFLLERFGGDETAAAAFGERYQAAKRRFLENGEVQVMPGAHDVLATLRERGTALAVATSTYRDAALERLARYDLARWFDDVVTGDQVANGKPAPDIFLLAAERLRVDPRACIAVEDSVAGVQAARDAGMTVFAVAHTFQPGELGQAHRVFADMRELHDTLTRDRR